MKAKELCTKCGQEVAMPYKASLMRNGLGNPGTGVDPVIYCNNVQDFSLEGGTLKRHVITSKVVTTIVVAIVAGLLLVALVEVGFLVISQVIRWLG